MNLDVQIPLWDLAFNSLGCIYPEVGLLDHMVVVFLIFFFYFRYYSCVCSSHLWMFLHCSGSKGLKENKKLSSCMYKRWDIDPRWRWKFLDVFEPTEGGLPWTLEATDAKNWPSIGMERSVLSPEGTPCPGMLEKNVARSGSRSPFLGLWFVALNKQMITNRNEWAESHPQRPWHIPLTELPIVTIFNFLNNCCCWNSASVHQCWIETEL